MVYLVFSKPQVDDFVPKRVVPLNKLFVDGNDEHREGSKERNCDIKQAAMKFLELLEQFLGFACSKRVRKQDWWLESMVCSV